MLPYGGTLEQSFNPLPAVRPGDAFTYAQGRARQSVSIRSRRLGREMLFAQQGLMFVVDVSIRSRRLGREMPAFIHAQLAGLNVSIRSRRLGREMPQSRVKLIWLQRCFNPLPAVRPGDARGLT